MAFCSLRLIPRLSALRNTRPDLDVRILANNQMLDLEQQQSDVAVRYRPVMAAPPGAIRMLEEIVVVCSPQLLNERPRPPRSPGDLRRHTLLHFDHAEG